MKKFPLKKPLFLNILIIVFSLLWTGAIVFNIIKWTEAFGYFSVSLAFEIATTILSVFVIFILLRFLFISYSISEKGVRLVFLWDLFGGNIKNDKIWKLVLADNQLYICFTNKSDQPQISRIIIDSKYYNEFYSELKKYNENVVFELSEIKNDTEE